MGIGIDNSVHRSLRGGFICKLTSVPAGRSFGTTSKQVMFNG
jgi:hypothetical protein